MWTLEKMGSRRTKNLTTEEIFKDEVLSNEILDIAGHYTFNNDDVKKK